MICFCFVLSSLYLSLLDHRLYLIRLRTLVFSSLGPLLRETVDVRNIPVSQRREVTIDLSSKCYI